MKLHEIIEIYLKYLKVKEKPSLTTARTNCNTLKRILPDIDHMEMTPMEIMDYIDARKDDDKSASTVERELNVLKASFNRIVKLNMIPKMNAEGYTSEYQKVRNITDWIKDLAPKGEPRSLIPSEEEVKAILYQAKRNSYDHYLFWKGLSLTAYRRSELLSVGKSMIDLNRKEMKVQDAKTGRWRTTHLYRDLYKFIEPLTDRELLFPIRKCNLYQRWYTCCEKASIEMVDGLPIYHQHDLRKYAIRFMQDKYNFPDDMVRVCYSGHTDDRVFKNIYNIVGTSSRKHFKELALAA